MPAYTVSKLPGLAFAVTDQNGKTWCVCDRQEDAERIAGVMNDYDEMLAACRLFIAWEDNTAVANPAEQYPRAVAAARAAITKAESRT